MIIELIVIWILVAAALWIHACVKYVQARRERNEKSSGRTQFRRGIVKMVEEGVIS